MNSHPLTIKKRAVLLHCHLFKNAGTTFNLSLKIFFGPNFFVHRDDDSMIKGGGKYLERFLSNHEEIKALSSHHIQFPLPAPPDINILAVFFIRHPIDRAGSVYLFERQQKSDTPGAQIAKKLSFQDYVLWRMVPKNGPVIRDFQSRVLLGRSIIRPNQEINHNQFSLIIQTLSKNPLVGLVEMYDESMVLFEEVLKDLYPEINLAYMRQNISPKRKNNIEERIDEVLSQLDSDTKKILLRENQWDLLLHTETEKIILDRIKNIPHFNEKLVTFRQRCQEIEKCEK